MPSLRTAAAALLASHVAAAGTQAHGAALERGSFLSQSQAQRRGVALLQLKGLVNQSSAPPALQLMQNQISLFTPGDDDAAARTLQSLDTNGNGKVDAAEIASFAQAQGLDSASAAGELATLDTDGDGALNAQELSGMLGSGGQQAAAVAVQQPLQPVQMFAARLVQQAPPAPPVQRAAPLQASYAPPAPQLPRMTPTSFASAATDISSAGALRLGEGVDYGAVRTNVQSSANAFVAQLSLEQKEEAAAQELEHSAAELRAKSTALSRRMIKTAMSAGSQAASQKAQEVLSTMLRLEAEETKKEIAAAALNAKAKAELREAHELMSIANSAMSAGLAS